MLRNKKKGFTLIELVIVIAIIGILIAIALPRFAEATQGARNRRIDANARTLAGAVTQRFADTQAWPADNDPDTITAAGITNTANATYGFEVRNNVITVVYTWAGGESYTGTFGTGGGNTPTGTARFTF